MMQSCSSPSGILLVDKPQGWNAFKLVAILRRRLGVRKIGHAGTLDPFATGVMVMLVGREYTKLSDSFLTCDKEYVGKIRLGISTDSYDIDGAETGKSELIPTLDQIETALESFQGEVEQTPPMFSAKKVGGKKLYELARKGITIERAPVKVRMQVDLVEYAYPYLTIKVCSSKGTYIRSLANDLGDLLGCGGHLVTLRRTRSGQFSIDRCVAGSLLEDDSFEVKSELFQDQV